MEINEAIKTIEVAMSEVEWEYPMDYAVAFEMAIKAMKEQDKKLTNGFTVIDNKTGCYPNCEKIALKEDWAKHLIYCDIDEFAITESGALILMDDCGNCAYVPSNRFTIEWLEN